jgi:hypothetical protein
MDIALSSPHSTGDPTLKFYLDLLLGVRISSSASLPSFHPASSILVHCSLVTTDELIRSWHTIHDLHIYTRSEKVIAA